MADCRCPLSIRVQSWMPSLFAIAPNCRRVLVFSTLVIVSSPSIGFLVSLSKEEPSDGVKAPAGSTPGAQKWQFQDPPIPPAAWNPGGWRPSKFADKSAGESDVQTFVDSKTCSSLTKREKHSLRSNTHSPESARSSSPRRFRKTSAAIQARIRTAKRQRRL